mmetsp:Transcript_10951/g.9884  ORF Transcript_10951/g.9884 Transcript_10951/m.9884 type:complete len:83 (+) Transcript_10951:87-335(+)
MFTEGKVPIMIVITTRRVISSTGTINKCRTDYFLVNGAILNPLEVIPCENLLAIGLLELSVLVYPAPSLRLGLIVSCAEIIG